MPNMYNPKIPAWQGCLSTEQKKMVRNHLSVLDKINGGVFTKPKRNVTVGDTLSNTPDKVVLFVSYGGTGADALYSLKTRLKNELATADYEDRIRFLAIDSDKNAQYVPGEDPNDIHAKKRYESSEFHWLDNASAKFLLKNEATDEWANPGLKQLIATDPTKLDGNGASNTRQIGRVLMLANAQTLDTKVQTLVGQLTGGKHAQLDVYIITGVSGGTGSGIIVDATYIVREAVKKAFPYPDRTRISGMLHLPPTGTGSNPTVVTKGNQNGYATLKEIDHFMTINRRGERYYQIFSPGYSVKSEQPIFDVCYMFDGNLTKAKLLNPRERATEAMCDSILDIITTMTVKGAGAEAQPIESMLSDTGTRAKTFVELADPSIAPRDANYIYCTLGYGKAIVPSDLIKAYVANGIYAFMYNNVYRNYRVDRGDVDAFIADAIVDVKEFNAQLQRNAIDKALEQRFCSFQPQVKGGPFFVVDLIRALTAEFEMQRNEIASKTLIIKKKEKLDQLSFVIQYLNDCNMRVFGVIAEALEQMKLHLNNESERLFHPNTEVNSYEFYPLDFTIIDDKSSAVIKFLDNIVSNNEKAAIAQNFAKEIWNKRFQWGQISTQIAGNNITFSGSKEFKAFWETAIGSRVDSEVENLLLKYYSKSPAMKYYTITAEDGKEVEAPDCAMYLKEAAARISSEMFGATGRSVPRLAMDLNLFKEYEGKANSLTYFLVPEKCENLKRHLQEVQGNKVLDSSSADTVSCLTLISGLPAFLAAWTKTAEPQYEAAVDIGTQGLHMTETKYGDNWGNFPNLMPETIWPQMEGYKDLREKERADKTRDLFFRALALGFAKRKVFAGTQFDSYEMVVLNDSLRPELKLFREAEYEHEGTAQYAAVVKALDDRCEQLAEQLFESKERWSNIIESKDLFELEFSAQYPDGIEKVSFELPNVVLTKPLNEGEVPSRQWGEELAADLLRTWPDFMFKVRGSVMVLEKLYEKVAKAQQVDNAIVKYTKYTALDLIKYDEANMFYTYFDPLSGEEILFEMEYGNNLQVQLKDYFVFRNYFQKMEKVDEALKETVLDMTNLHDLDRGAPRIAKQKELADLGAALQAKIANLAIKDRNNPLLGAAFKKKAADTGLDAQDVAAFYEAMYNAAGKPMHVDVAR